MPVPSMSFPSLVVYLPTVSFKTPPFSKGKNCCMALLPKVVCPIIIPLPDSFRADTRISAALAVLFETKTMMLKGHFLRWDSNLSVLSLKYAVKIKPSGTSLSAVLTISSILPPLHSDKSSMRFFIPATCISSKQLSIFPAVLPLKFLILTTHKPGRCTTVKLSFLSPSAY